MPVLILTNGTAYSQVSLETETDGAIFDELYTKANSSKNHSNT
jgi:hypothetical protein